MDPEVRQVMVDALSLLGNPSSIHREGQRARALVETARREVADMLGTAPGAVVFTSGATEANNLALATIAARQGTIVSSVVEHPSVLAAVDGLETAGRTVRRLRVDELGRLVDSPEALPTPLAGLSLMLANNETGRVYPVARWAEAARALGGISHTDAAQAPGRLTLDADALGVDLLSISAHKFGGPKGIGALVVHGDLELQPQMVGGHQERGRRGGTENVAAIAAMGVAARLARTRVESDAQKMRAIRDRLWSAIVEVAPDAVWQARHDEGLPNTLNVRFPGLDGETLLMNCDLEGLAVSAGSACSAGSLNPSHVIVAMGLCPDQARGSLRLSVGRETTVDDITETARRLAAILARSQ